MTKFKKRVKQYNRYPVELKRKIAKEYLSGAASYAILAEEHGLRDRGVVKEIVKWYKRQLENQVSDAELMEKSGENQELKSGDLTKDQELAELKKKLALSELKVEMLETLIDEAESVLSIDIRKKSGTNQ